MAVTVDDYVRALPPWQAEIASQLVNTILSASSDLVPTIKWSQPVFEFNGPVCYLKGHKRHLTFGFWRGASMMNLDDRLESSGEMMAHLKLTEGMPLLKTRVIKLVRTAVELHRIDGNPTAAKVPGARQKRGPRH